MLAICHLWHRHRGYKDRYKARKALKILHFSWGDCLEYKGRIRRNPQQSNCPGPWATAGGGKVSSTRIWRHLQSPEYYLHDCPPAPHLGHLFLFQVPPKSTTTSVQPVYMHQGKTEWAHIDPCTHKTAQWTAWSCFCRRGTSEPNLLEEVVLHWCSAQKRQFFHCPNPDCGLIHSAWSSMVKA